MSQFYSAVMTNKGAALLAEAIAGNVRIQFTTLVSGDGEYSEEERTVLALQAMTSLKSQKQSVGFSNVVVESETSVHLTGALDNEELIDGYYVREVGIYAKNALDDEAEPILYSITVAQVADYMPPYNGLTPTTIIQEYFAAVNNSAEVTLVSGSGAYALADDLNKESKRISKLEKVIMDKTEDSFSDEKLYEKGDCCIYDNVLYEFTREKSSGEWDPSAVKATTLLTTFSKKYNELNSNFENIITGVFDNAKHRDLIQLPKAVAVESIVFVQPMYNTSTTAKCIFQSLRIPAGRDTFELDAWDTATQAVSTSTTLAGYYVVIPLGL